LPRIHHERKKMRAKSHSFPKMWRERKDAREAVLPPNQGGGATACFLIAHPARFVAETDKERMNNNDVYVLPMSLAQKRMWFLERMEPGGAAYHIPVAVALKGRLETRALERRSTGWWRATRFYAPLLRRLTANRRRSSARPARPLAILDAAGTTRAERLGGLNGMRRPSCLSVDLSQGRCCACTCCASRRMNTSWWRVLHTSRRTAGQWMFYPRTGRALRGWPGMAGRSAALWLAIRRLCGMAAGWLASPALNQLECATAALRGAPPLLDTAPRPARPARPSRRGRRQQFTLPRRRLKIWNAWVVSSGATLNMFS